MPNACTCGNSRVYGTAAQLSRLFKCLANRYIASATGGKKESRERIYVSTKVFDTEHNYLI